MIEILISLNKLRCNGRVGFIPGNQKGFCTTRGILAKIDNLALCPSCFERWKEKNKVRQERWAFCKEELRNPTSCNSSDKLVAQLRNNNVFVSRNGVVDESVQDRLRIDELFHPLHKQKTELWDDVLVDKQGNFLQFVVPHIHRGES
jgi:hypothetical protein